MAFVTKEVPTGVVDGANKTYQLTQNADTLDDVFVDGAIYLGTINHVSGSNLFSLADAPTTSIFVDYIVSSGGGTTPSSGNTSLSSLISKLRTELRMDSDDKIWSTSEKTDFINEAYLQVQRDGNYNWNENQGNTTQVLTSGTQEYDLPSDFIRFDYVQLQNDNQPLQLTNKVNVLRRGTTGSSDPDEYYIYGGKIGLYPTPSSARTLQYLYRKRLPTITSNQGSELPTDFDRAIIKYAVYLAWSSPRGNQGEAASKINDYQRAIDRLFIQYQLQSAQSLRFTYQTDMPSYYSDKALY